MEAEKKKDFDAVNFMREQRDRLNTELINMSKKEIIAYFKKIRLESKVKPGAQL